MITNIKLKQRALQVTLLFGFTIVNTLIMYQMGECKCNAGAFKFWFVLMYFPSIILSFSIGEFYKKQNLILKKIIFRHFYIVLLLSIYSLFLIWYFPQKYSMNMITGFWHGPIYDRLIETDYNLLYSRGLHILLGIVLFFLAHFKSKKISKTTVNIIILCCFLITESESNRVGNYLLKDNFPIKLSGTCVDLYTTSKKEKTYHLELLKQADYHCEDLKKQLHLNLDKKVSVFSYQSYSQKKLIFGAAETDVCDVKNIGIHINEESLPHSSLRHELVHALLAKDGFYGLGFHPNMSFTEGIASALAPGFSSQSLHELAASAIKTLKITKASDFFGNHFWTYSGRSSYTIAGSFWRYLLDKGEQESILKMYSGKSPNWKHQKSIQEHQDHWFHFMNQLDISNSEIYAEKIFNTPSPFHSQCIHSKNTLRKNNKNPYDKFRQPHNWDLSKYPQWSDQFSKNDLHLQRKKILRKKIPAITELIRLQSQKIKTIDDIVYSLDMIDTLMKQKKVNIALQSLKSLYEQTKSKFIGNALKRKIIARFYIMSFFTPEQSQKWMKYLSAGKNLPKTTEANWMSTYLSLRSRSGYKWFQANKKISLQPPQPILALPKNFYFEYNMMIAKHFAKSKETDLQWLYLHKAKNFTSGERKKRISIHLRYLESSMLENSYGGQKIP